jgi:predicted nucleic acid-binding protein
VIAADSSVVIAAIAPWHVAHMQARAALAGMDARLPAHAAFETTSTLSRMPEGQRMSAALVLEALEVDFPKKWLALSGNDQRASLSKAVQKELRGGALYDALIAATAAKHGATLISADRRAQPTYEAMDIEAHFIDPE